MILCDARNAARLLEGQLSEEDTIRFETHLAECSTCQDNLVELAGGKRVLEVASNLLSSSVEIPQWTSLASQTSGLDLGAFGGRSDFLEPTVFLHQDKYDSVDLSILAPSDDPSFMGRIGNYEVQGIIGRGGMGIVFRALDRALSRNVAIKVLDPSMASIGAARQRFAMEARAMAAISHEHVVPVYTVDTHRGLPYFAMEYIPGGTLESRIRQDGPLDLLSILQISRQIALALGAAHDCGLVHRDIKPANVLLDRGVERVRVADFGLARVSSDASYTRSGFIAGTPQFMSPEQVRGEVCTELSDLFSLGSVMYAMCTSHSPFRCESMYGAMQRVVHDTPRSICEQAPSLPEWLERFIGTLLSKLPADRFDSATKVASLLELEIAHAQNPSQCPKPDRALYGPQITRVPNAQSKTRRYARMLAIVTLLGSLAAAVISFRRWNEEVPVNTTVRLSQEITTAPSTVPLWNNDGTRVTQELSTQLDRSFYGSDTLPVTDPWQQQVRILQQAMDAFEQQTP